MLWTFEILWIYLLLERSDENMKKKIAIMLTLILATGTFTACTAEEKMYNGSLSPTVSTSVGVSVSTETSATAITEKATETTTQKKPTVGKIRRLFRQRLRFRKHNPRFRTTARIQ